MDRGHAPRTPNSNFRIQGSRCLTPIRLPAATGLDELSKVVDSPGLLHEPFMALKRQALAVGVHGEAIGSVEDARHLRDWYETELARSGGRERDFPERCRGLRNIGSQTVFVDPDGKEPV